ncbi:MAG TPA: hypothetical protein VGQ49_08190 [Bryobacteraceae bacterium]|jgi:hypothetical protein|nr:hypothetical protein [Bryobacteraceae bacterium]
MDMNPEVIAKAGPSPRLSCPEKLQLRTLYGEALKRRDGAINQVLLVRGKVSIQEYDRIRALADEARAALNLARRALEEHKENHGC